jgi:hypothetical protein
MTDRSNRDDLGRFAIGNPGGPGRPRRKVERDYLGALSDAVSLTDWKRITERAVQDALDGDSAARAWLSRHLLPMPGVKHEPLHRLAADDLAGVDPVANDADGAASLDRLLRRLL